MSQKQIDLRVANLDCEHDAAAIERGLTGFDGLATLKVYLKSAKVSLTYDPTTTNAESLKKELDSLGFPPQEGLTMPEQPKPWRNPKVLTSVASGALLLVGWLLSLARVSEIASTGLNVTAIVVGGYYFGREALEELIFEREIGVELLMAEAVIIAELMGQYCGDGLPATFERVK